MARAASLRIGVSGHRAFDNLPSVRAAATRVAAALLDQHGGPLEIWSSLAEGADRLVATAVLETDPRARLVAVLPLVADDYRRDFANAASTAEFDRLLGLATEVHVTGPDRESATRESAYARAGHAVVAAVSVLVAVWDGEPARGLGGTAEIVEAARAAGREVVVIPVTRPSVAS